VTGRRRKRINDSACQVSQEVPALRLIDDELCTRVQARVAAEVAPTQPDNRAPAFWESRRPQHLLTGKVVCGACGGLFYARGRDYLSCHAARRYLCRNTTSVRRGPLEARVVDALRRQLMQPEFVAEFTPEWNRLAAEVGLARVAEQQALEAVERQLGNLIDAIADGLRAPGLQAKLDALEAQRTKLIAEAGGAPAPPPALHLNLAEVYRDRVATLEQALADRKAPDVLEAARALIDRVIVHPPEGPGSPPGIELVGQLLAMLQAGGARVGSEEQAFAASVLRSFESSAKADSGVLDPPLPNENPRPRLSRPELTGSNRRPASAHAEQCCGGARHGSQIAVAPPRLHPRSCQTVEEPLS
jgi:hypothetical protein